MLIVRCTSVPLWLQHRMVPPGPLHNTRLNEPHPVNHPERLPTFIVAPTLTGITTDTSLQPPAVATGRLVLHRYVR